jgi:hypothetical protein
LLLVLQAAPATLASASDVNQQALDRLDEMDEELAARDRRVRELEAELSGLRSALDIAHVRTRGVEALAGTAATALSSFPLPHPVSPYIHTQSHGAGAVGDAEGARVEIASLRAQLAEAQAAAAAAGSATNSANAELRAAVASRDKKLRSLQAALSALKEEFVRAEEEHAVATAALRAATSAGTLHGGSRRPSARPPKDEAGAAAAEGFAGQVGEGEGAGGGGAAAAAAAASASRVAALTDTVARLRAEVTAMKARVGHGARGWTVSHCRLIIPDPIPSPPTSPPSFVHPCRRLTVVLQSASKPSRRPLRSTSPLLQPPLPKCAASKPKLPV